MTAHIPDHANTGMVRSRVHKALEAAGQYAEAAAFLAATDEIKNDPVALIEATRKWVDIPGDLNVSAVTAAPGPKVARSGLDGLSQRLGDEQPRWQYAVVNVGMFNSAGRMANVLGTAGENGWDLVGVYDKSSNWFQGMEKGYMLLKRPVPPRQQPGSWCIIIHG